MANTRTSFLSYRTLQVASELQWHPLLQELLPPGSRLHSRPSSLEPPSPNGSDWSGRERGRSVSSGGRSGCSGVSDDEGEGEEAVLVHRISQSALDAGRTDAAAVPAPEGTSPFLSGDGNVDK